MMKLINANQTHLNQLSNQLPFRRMHHPRCRLKILASKINPPFNSITYAHTSSGGNEHTSLTMYT